MPDVFTVFLTKDDDDLKSGDSLFFTTPLPTPPPPTNIRIT